MHDVRKDLIALAEIHSRATGLSTATIAKKSANHAHLFYRLAAGSDITTRRAANIIQWFADHWMQGAPWPTGVYRPPPSEDSPAKEAESPLPKDKNHHVQTKAVAKLMVFEETEESMRAAMSTVRQVIHSYADGRPRENKWPRHGSDARRALDLMVNAGDSRFIMRLARQRAQAARADSPAFRRQREQDWRDLAPTRRRLGRE